MQLNVAKMIFFLSTRSVLCSRICRKCVCGRCFAPDSTVGAHDAPPDPLVDWEGDTPPQTPTHSAPSASRPSRLRRSGLPLCTQFLAAPLVTFG